MGDIAGELVLIAMKFLEVGYVTEGNDPTRIFSFSCHHRFHVRNVCFAVFARPLCLLLVFVGAQRQQLVRLDYHF